jgi:hypothetical protein
MIRPRGGSITSHDFAHLAGQAHIDRVDPTEVETYPTGRHVRVIALLACNASHERLKLWRGSDAKIPHQQTLAAMVQRHRTRRVSLSDIGSDHGAVRAFSIRLNSQSRMSSLQSIHVPTGTSKVIRQTLERMETHLIPTLTFEDQPFFIPSG